MAWTEKLASGKYRGGYRDSAGDKQYTKPPHVRKSDALHAAQEAEVKARREAARTDGALSARTPWGVWWDMIVDDRVSEETNTDSTEMYLVSGYVRPRWELTPLNKIEHKDVQKWVNNIRDGKDPGWVHTRKPEPSYVHRIYAVFRSSIQKAMDEEILTASPCAGVKLPTIRRKRKQFISEDDNQKITAKLRADYAAAIEFEFETGLRPSEVTGFHANRIDFDHHVIEVCEVLVNRKNVIRPYPKDEDARLVPLTVRAEEILKERLANRALDVGCGVRHTDDAVCQSPLVFLTVRGTPINIEMLGNRMRYVGDNHGVPRRSPYAARRGFATRAGRGGVDAFLLAAIMGHEDLEQTNEYVQETQMVGKLRAAFGEHQPLQVVDGARGAEDGADLEKQAQESYDIDGTEHAV